ncbi:hypothetical protein BU17DRAFT_63346 [Hysterangium stoloniferum]|nr:hypothetical protein BU17DRAFT_63346 [Hysterangium stoloniferum]
MPMTWLFLLSLSCCPFHLKLSLSTRHVFFFRPLLSGVRSVGISEISRWSARIFAIVAAYRSDVISKLRSRQNDSTGATLVVDQCTAVCANFTTILGHCNFSGPPSCTCTVSFVSAKIQCLLCERNSGPLNLAGAKFLLDDDVARCHKAGIQIGYSLLLDPAAAAIVQRVYRTDSVLRKRQTVFLALQIIGGHIGIFLVLVLAVFSRRYCVFVVLSKAYRLYRGTSENTFLQPLGDGRENLCLVQAALTNGAQVMTASSTLSLVIRLWLDLRTAICGETKEPKKNQCITVLVLCPAFISDQLWGTHALLSNSSAYVWGNPDNITHHSGTRSAYVSVLRSLSHRIPVFEPSNPYASVSVSSSISSNFSVLADMMQAAIPLLGTIILGTRSDIVGAVVLWRRNDAVKA